MKKDKKNRQNYKDSYDEEKQREENYYKKDQKSENHCEEKQQNTEFSHYEKQQPQKESYCEEQRYDVFKEFESVGKNFEGELRRRAQPEGEEASPPIEIQLMGPLVFKTVKIGDWVWLQANISWAANADNTRIVFEIRRTTYDGQLIASSADTESQGGFDTSTLIGVDKTPLLNGCPPIYFVRALLYFGDASFPATSANTGDISQGAINIPNFTFSGVVINKNISPYPNSLLTNAYSNLPY